MYLLLTLFVIAVIVVLSIIVLVADANLSAFMHGGRETFGEDKPDGVTDMLNTISTQASERIDE